MNAQATTQQSHAANASASANSNMSRERAIRLSCRRALHWLIVAFRPAIAWTAVMLCLTCSAKPRRSTSPTAPLCACHVRCSKELVFSDAPSHVRTTQSGVLHSAIYTNFPYYRTLYDVYIFAFSRIYICSLTHGQSSKRRLARCITKY